MLAPVSDVSFNAFVISLATAAAVHFGDVADPGSGEKATVNLDAAGHAIEMLALLEEKTKGNLTDEETQFLRQVLFELRMRFVEAKQAGGEQGKAADDSEPTIIVP